MTSPGGVTKVGAVSMSGNSRLAIMDAVTADVWVRDNIYAAGTSEAEHWNVLTVTFIPDQSISILNDNTVHIIDNTGDSWWWKQSIPDTVRKWMIAVFVASKRVPQRLTGRSKHCSSPTFPFRTPRRCGEFLTTALREMESCMNYQ